MKSGSITIFVIIGAYLDISFLTSGNASSILPMMKARPSLAFVRASRIISIVIPLILMSIWRAVIPSFVPVTLKSMSPAKSSKPWMSERIA